MCYQSQGREYKLLKPRGESRLELGVHVFGIMWNYFGICPFIYRLLLGNKSGSGSWCTRGSPLD